MNMSNDIYCQYCYNLIKSFSIIYGPSAYCAVCSPVIGYAVRRNTRAYARIEKLSI